MTALRGDMGQPTSLQSLLVRRDDLLVRDGFGATVIARPEGGDVVSLRGTGVVIWELLARPISTADAVASLAQLYRVAPEEIESDVAAALHELIGRGLCRPAEPA
jgi:coenzyme PQQ synthesis protein D (PqqD)